MTMHSNLGRRVLSHGLIFTTTILACAALQAEQHDQHGDKTEKFIQKAAMGGQMEVQMGQLAQQKGQAQEVKSLGATLVRDHTQANQKLQQLAQSKNIHLNQYSSVNTESSLDQSSSATAAGSPPSGTSGKKDYSKTDDHGKHAKHQQELQKLRSQSGAEFDKAFVRMAIKDHKKDISEFEKARADVTDSQVRSFIDETLPKLRNHLQMAQSAARTVGVDESSIAAEVDNSDSDTAAGAPASGTRGSDKPSSPASKQDRSSLDRSSLDNDSRLNGATDSDLSGTVNQNNPRASLDANVGDREINADVDVDRSDRSISADVDTEKDHKIFQKGDGKVLGLPTDKNDGKFLGIIPNPRANDNDDDASIEADVDVDHDTDSVGGAASTEVGTSDKDQTK